MSDETVMQRTGIREPQARGTERAFITLSTTDDFIEGALILAESLRATHSRYEFLVAVGPNVSPTAERQIECAGLRILRLDQIPPQVAGSEGRWSSTTQKLSLFGLFQFDTLVYIDADCLVLRNVDHLMDAPSLGAVATRSTATKGGSDMTFNSGVMVIRPDATEYPDLLAHASQHIPQYIQRASPFSDQDLLNDFFADWGEVQRLPDTYNVFWGSIDQRAREEGLGLKTSLPDERQIAIVHFTGPHKPWVRPVWFTLKSLVRPFRHKARPPTSTAFRILSKYFALGRDAKSRIRAGRG